MPLGSRQDSANSVDPGDLFGARTHVAVQRQSHQLDLSEIRRFLQQAVQPRPQYCRLNRLVDEIVAACLQCVLQRHRLVQRRNKDDRRTAVLIQRPDCAAKVDAARATEIDVEQESIDRLLPRLAHRLFGAIGLQDAHAVLLQEALHELADGRHVVHNQYVLVSERLIHH